MANVNGTEIDLMPTDGMRTEAERYRGWKSDGEQGGTEVAATRASQILSGDELSPETVITMAAWFARHEVDKQGEGFSPDEDGYPSPGRVAWAAWGGDAGQVWSAAKADRIKALQDRSAMEMERPYPNEHAARLQDPEQYDSLRRINDEGGNGVDFIYGIKEGETELQAIRFRSSIFTAAEARTWLADHDLNPIEFEEATGDGEARSLTGKYQRAELTTFDEVEDRTYEFPFSSEFPVARYFGNEILSHEANAADLSRLNDGAPLLFNHNPDRVIGVVEGARIDSKGRRGYARVRFSRNPFAQEILSDVKDGVLRNVSFGYSIDKMEERGSGDYVATAWAPYEVSIVSVPADKTVGIGRALTPTEPAASAAP